MPHKIPQINPAALSARHRQMALRGVARARRDGTKLGRPSTAAILAPHVRELRKKKNAQGKPMGYSAIAAQTGLSIGSVWKILNPKK